MNFDLLIVKDKTAYDNYCGSDILCKQGGEQIFSLLSWIIILGASLYIGYYIRKLED